MENQEFTKLHICRRSEEGRSITQLKNRRKAVWMDHSELGMHGDERGAHLWFSYAYLFSHKFADFHEENMTSTVFVFYPVECLEQY